MLKDLKTKLWNILGKSIVEIILIESIVLIALK